MTLNDLRNVVNEVCDDLPKVNKDPKDINVAVPYVPSVPTLGATSCVPVRSAGLGFDWDNGKFFIDTEKKISLYGENNGKTHDLANNREFIGQLMDEIEDFLSSRDVELPCSQKGDGGANETIVLMGKDYDELSGRFQRLLNGWLQN